MAAYRATVTATGWYKASRYLSSWREGAIERPQTITGYGSTEQEARTAALRKIVARGMRAISTVEVGEAL